QPKQGVQQSERIGNQIKIVSGVVRGTIACKPYDAIFNPVVAPMMIKMYLCSLKEINDSNPAGSTIVSSMFQLNNTAIGFQANLLDLNLPLNKELLTIYATKTFEIGQTYSNIAVASDNSKFIMPFYFNWGKHFKQALKFNDNATNT
ncbi:hypothetical protein MEO41_28235, partial [Dolichospermum sp. ST_sed4]|nr:hypothetical protein [Dolichospermum sp. ST_sed4]